MSACLDPQNAYVFRHIQGGEKYQYRNLEGKLTTGHKDDVITCWVSNPTEWMEKRVRYQPKEYPKKWLTAVQITEDDRWYNYPKDFIGYQKVEFRCKDCLNCRKRISHDWAMRASQEILNHQSGCFLTLTLDPAKLNDPLRGEGTGYTLNIKDTQKFIKRLRKHIAEEDDQNHLRAVVKQQSLGNSKTPDRITTKIKTFAVGEYGGKAGRPHYHILIFGWQPKDLTPTPGGHYEEKDSAKDFTEGKIDTRPPPKGKPKPPPPAKGHYSRTLDDLWKLGYTYTEDLTPQSAAYCTQYCNKKSRELTFLKLHTMLAKALPELETIHDLHRHQLEKLKQRAIKLEHENTLVEYYSDQLSQLGINYDANTVLQIGEAYKALMVPLNDWKDLFPHLTSPFTEWIESQQEDWPDYCRKQAWKAKNDLAEQPENGNARFYHAEGEHTNFVEQIPPQPEFKSYPWFQLKNPEHTAHLGTARKLQKPEIKTSSHERTAFRRYSFEVMQNLLRQQPANGSVISTLLKLGIRSFEYLETGYDTKTDAYYAERLYTPILEQGQDKVVISKTTAYKFEILLKRHRLTLLRWRSEFHTTSKGIGKLDTDKLIELFSRPQVDNPNRIAMQYVTKDHETGNNTVSVSAIPPSYWESLKKEHPELHRELRNAYDIHQQLYQNSDDVKRNSEPLKIIHDTEQELNKFERGYDDLTGY